MLQKAIMTEDTGLYMTSIVLVVLFYLIVFYLSSRYSNGPPGTITATCQPGQCRLTRATGLKECFDTSSPLIIDPSLYSCVEPYTCPPRTYALLSDGSTSTRGLCDANTICNCLPRPQCATEITATFKASGGTVNDVLPGQPTTFSVSTVYSQKDGTRTVIGPIQYDPKVELCSVPRQWLQEGRLYLWGNDCPFGTMAYTDSSRRQLACYAGKIECDDYPVSNRGKLNCPT